MKVIPETRTDIYAFLLAIVLSVLLILITLWYLQTFHKMYGGQNPKVWICILIPILFSFTNPYEISRLDLSNRFDLAIFVFRDTVTQRKAKGTCHDKRKQKRQSGMDNLYTHATTDTTHKTKTSKTKNTTQKTKRMNNSDPTKKPEVNPCSFEG